ncbi:YrpD family protein [Bacillus cereus]|uniref:YrpD family protein n=1 Tax=Bacillus cereus TaxID=1396 RepID=UPI0036701604
MKAHLYIKAFQAEPIKKGIGGRAVLNSTGSVLATKVTLPEIKNSKGTLKATGGELYMYSGFSGPVESDIGFLYSETYNVWKPYMKIGSNKDPIYIEGKDEFTNLNGFKPGTEVQLTIYKNLNGNLLGNKRKRLYRKINF